MSANSTRVTGHSRQICFGGAPRRPVLNGPEWEIGRKASFSHLPHVCGWLSVAGKPHDFARCWDHARRKLHHIYQQDGSEVAAEALSRIAQIYEAEAGILERVAFNRFHILRL